MEPVYTPLLNDLTTQVNNGLLKPGQYILSENILSKKYGISRVSVRSALEKLAISGILEKRPGKGTIVANQVPRVKPNILKSLGILWTGLGINDPLFSKILEGIKEEVDNNGWKVHLFHEISLVKDYISILDGLIVVYLAKGSSYIEDVKRIGLPFVLIGKYRDEIKEDYVTVENEKGVYKATTHLIELGHKKIGFIKGWSSSAMGQQRLEGYQKALKDCKIPFSSKLVVPGGWNEEGGYQGMLKLLGRNSRLTAVFAASDPMAIGAMKAIKGVGHKIPEDISVVGFMDTSVAAFADPPLTTVRMPVRGMGLNAAQSFINKVTYNGDSQIKISLETDLIIRESCASANRSKDR